MEVFPKDVLLRVAGRTLARYGVPVVAGARRGPVEVPYTFSRADAATCASYIDRDGLLRKAAANVLRVEWVDLDGDGIRETPGLLLEGSRVNLCLRSEDFGTTWVVTGTPTRTPAETVLGELVLDLIGDDDGAAVEDYEQVVTYTGDGTKALSFFVKAGTAASTRVDVQDTTAPANRGDLTITWSGGVPSVVAGGGAVHLKTELIASGVYRIQGTVAGVIAANSNRIRVFPAGATGSATGNVRCGGVMTENAVFPSSYIKTVASTVTRAADSLTVPFAQGPNTALSDISMLWRLARPAHADASGALGVNPGIYDLGDAGTNHLWGYFDGAARNHFFAAESGGSVSVNPAIPAGAELGYAVHYNRDTATGKWKVRADVTGAGYGSYSSLTAAALAAFNTQMLRVGGIQGGTGNNLFGLMVDGIVFRGAFSRPEMLAVP